jgi:two-component system CheB/CheR fusion protein
MAPPLLYPVRKGGFVLAHRPPALDGVHILVVEDVWDILEVFSILLRAEGALVSAASTGREASDLARQRDFDVVLTDLGLPDVPGDILIRQIRGSGRQRARVVAVTGFGEPYITRALQAGADVVFTKPVEWTRILDYLTRPGLAASA